jgi:hypothetical protein
VRSAIPRDLGGRRVDEIGFMPFDHKDGELLFNALAHRHGRRSVLITSNLAFREWSRVFGGDEKLATALLDRLAEQAAVITTKGKSHRMRKRSDKQEAGESAPPPRRLTLRSRRSQPRRRPRSARLPATTEQTGGSVSECRSGSASGCRDQAAPSRGLGRGQ